VAIASEEFRPGTIRRCCVDSGSRKRKGAGITAAISWIRGTRANSVVTGTNGKHDQLSRDAIVKASGEERFVFERSLYNRSANIRAKYDAESWTCRIFRRFRCRQVASIKQLAFVA